MQWLQIHLNYHITVPTTIKVELDDGPTNICEEEIKEPTAK